ncbi:MAG: radical SAM family heme chaperone HemW [Gammaproteobacteria bacterium]|nr:radical SAM family heme chaperone HemW [Gammaproteobacteria bacterium]
MSTAPRQRDVATIDAGRVPVSLYVHIPWCVRKCPYCDFNSHPTRGELPEGPYVAALLDDLDHERDAIAGRTIHSVFIGGGTPSLFAPASIARLLRGIARRVDLADDCEVTLEANPGTVDAGRFAGFREAGVNRLSIGVQSFDDRMLRRLGRIHGAHDALVAARSALAAGFDGVNLDLMFGLPGQSHAGAVRDVEMALELAPGHVSYYQLTLEPNTLFHVRPPELPQDDAVTAMWDHGRSLLEGAGYAQYEVSAYAVPGRACRHNLNYWCFGDYAGIGAGAHGKYSRADGAVVRTVKHKHPTAYLQAAGDGRLLSRRVVERRDLTVEFMMNALRIRGGVSMELYSARTGLPAAGLRAAIGRGRELGLLAPGVDRICPTDVGYRFVDRLVELFLEEEAG